MKKLQELAQKEVALLEKELAHLREELRELKFKVSQNQQKDVRDVREKRKLVAQMMTIIRQKKLGKGHYHSAK